VAVAYHPEEYDSELIQLTRVSEFTTI
jgi:hypothetical protein